MGRKPLGSIPGIHEVPEATTGNTITPGQSTKFPAARYKSQFALLAPARSRFAAALGPEYQQETQCWRGWSREEGAGLG